MPACVAEPTEALLAAIAELGLWQQVTELALAGYTLVRGCLSTSETAVLRSRATKLLTSPVAVEAAAGREVWRLFDHDEAFVRVLEDDRVATLLTVLLGEGAMLSSLRITSVAVASPARQAGVSSAPARSEALGGALYASAIWCLNDWKRGYGATEVLVGSHRAGPPGDGAAPTMSPIECPAGSVILTNGNLWSRTGAYSAPGALPCIGVVGLHCRRYVVPLEPYPSLAARLGPGHDLAAAQLRPPTIGNREHPDL